MARCELSNGLPIENEKHWLGHKEYLLRCPAAVTPQGYFREVSKDGIVSQKAWQGEIMF